MLITIIILLAGIAGGFVNYYAAKGQLFNKKGKPKRNGWIFLVCILAVVVLAVAQKFGQDYLDDRKEHAQQILTAKHDSDLQAKYDASLIANTLKIKNNFDSTTDNQTEILSTTLGQYNLALDSANNRIVRLVKDSSKTRVVEPENPTLFLNRIEFFKIDSVKLFGKFYKRNVFKVSVSCIDASSCDFRIQASFVLADKNFSNLRYSGTYSALESEEVLVKNTTDYSFYTTAGIDSFSYIICWIRGTYKNIDESKQFRINSVNYMNYPSGFNGMLNGATKKKVIELIKSKQ